MTDVEREKRVEEIRLEWIECPSTLDYTRRMQMHEAMGYEYPRTVKADIAFLLSERDRLVEDIKAAIRKARGEV